MMAGRPPFDQFDADSEDIESYLERLQEYLIPMTSKKTKTTLLNDERFIDNSWKQLLSSTERFGISRRS